ncbi:hypothetical protein Y032_0118g713 [Ancylostoma ceylanicum]|uniref:Uncharacterized protein n=1 Tax=Ancylostoma ceylanicum TaxID=53326 RepID=A0A016TBD6_9BILA|nr:hypothetical protein Y032_0118g713 [Ancylostoma ceylanicum]
MFIPLLLVILPILQPTTSIKCWLWHHGGVPYELVTNRLDSLNPQCYFHLDLPCFMEPITFNTRAGFDYSTKERNACFIDPHEEAQLTCVCDTDECSTNCTQIVKMWRESRDYQAKGVYGDCMNQYINDCFAGKIKQPVKGETMDGELEKILRKQRK